MSSSTGPDAHRQPSPTEPTLAPERAPGQGPLVYGDDRLPVLMRFPDLSASRPQCAAAESVSGESACELERPESLPDKGPSTATDTLSGENRTPETTAPGPHDHRRDRRPVPDRSPPGWLGGLGQLGLAAVLAAALFTLIVMYRNRDQAPPQRDRSGSTRVEAMEAPQAEPLPEQISTRKPPRPATTTPRPQMPSLIPPEAISDGSQADDMTSRQTETENGAVPSESTASPAMDAADEAMLGAARPGGSAVAPPSRYPSTGIPPVPSERPAPAATASRPRGDDLPRGRIRQARRAPERWQTQRQ